METIFGNSGIGNAGTGLGLDEQTEYEAIIRARIADSVDYETAYLALHREENQAYYNGILPALPGADVENGDERESVNKSTFISTDVRDTILTILPSLIRIFTSANEKIAEFVPSNAAQTELAKQQYDYINYVFYNDNPGFLILHSLLKDALTVRAGIVQWWTDNDEEVTENQYTNITQEQYQYLISEAPEVDVVELEQNSDGTLDITLRYLVNKPLTKVEAVPPEEFRISRNAKDVETSRLVGRERNVSLSFLAKKGYDPEMLIDYISSPTVLSEERYLRNPGLADDSFSEDGIQFGQWFIRVDGDGDGIDELRYIETIGNNYEIIADFIVTDPKFAIWCGDPRPHTAIGDCMADITKDIQRMKTNMMRGQLDNLAETINPRTVVNELLTNIEDVLNDEVGAVIRTRGDPNAAVAFTKTPYAGEEVQVSIDYLDKVRASRTGITEASKGLDPKAMQSTALSGIDAIISGAQERIELIARILAETGLKAMFKGLVREVVNNPNVPRTIMLRGEWADVDPSLYDPNLRVEINPTLGKGSDMVRLQALGEVKVTQETILTKFGVTNPVVSPVEYRNTLVDILAIANIKNPDRYFKPVTPEIMRQIEATPQEPDPAAVLAQAELEKVKKDTIIASAKQDNADQKMALEISKAKQDDDFRRDKLNVDSAVRVLDIIMDPKPQTITPGEVTVPPGVLSANQPD